MRKVFAFLAVVLVPLLGGCGEDAVNEIVRSKATPVILISIDTLRADRLPVYGFSGVSTPHIDALRRDGVLFENAFTHYPLTFPAHATLFTGLLPQNNGARDNIGFTIRDDVPTLPGLLGENGFATAGVISAYVLRSDTGVGRGFAFYDDDVAPVGRVMTMGNMQRHGKDSVELAIDWLEKQPVDKPFFLFLHLYEPHTPYEPPEPYASQYQNRYVGEIAYVDELVGRLLDEVRKKGIYDDALIVFLSDHGEGLNDHGESEHGMFLYREALHVPMMIKLPGQKLANRTVKTPMGLVDVMPTILEITETPRPAKLDGKSMVSVMSGQEEPTREVYSESFYSRFHYGWSELHSLSGERFHYIQAPTPELYDVQTDPKETQNVLEQNRRVFFAMKESLDPLIVEASGPGAINPEEAAKLAALGYLGSTVEVGEGEVLPDPKDKVDVYQAVGEAFRKHANNEYEEAVRIADQILATDPKIGDLWELKSRSLMRLGRLKEAAEAGKEGLRAAPTAKNLAMQVANILYELDEFEEAKLHAELGIETLPGVAREILSRIAIAQGDMEEARKQAEAAIEADDDRVNARITLARLAIANHEFEKALKYLDEAVEAKKGSREVLGLHHLRGDALARLGRTEEAENAFRLEIERFPDDPRAYRNLILLLVSEGRTDEATSLVFALIEKAPLPPSYIAMSKTLRIVGDSQGARYWALKGLEKFPGHPELLKLAKG